MIVVLGILAVVIGVVIGLLVLLEDGHTRPDSPPDDVGWVYFLSPLGGAVQDPPAPIKIGMTRRNPYEDRLPEIETMSAQPLEMLDALFTAHPDRVEKAIHQQLKRYRRHGEWFDRDVVLAFLDNLREKSK